MPTGSLNRANLDMTYITFTYAPLARTQLHDETVFLCIQEEKERNSVQNQPVSATNQVCVWVCVSMLLCVPVIYLECNELEQYFIIFLSWFYGLTRFTQQGIICFGSLAVEIRCWLGLWSSEDSTGLGIQDGSSDGMQFVLAIIWWLIQKCCPEC